MESQTTENILLGIQHNEFKKPPIFTINRFLVYDRGKLKLLTLKDQQLNLNFQIEGTKNEKLVVRIFKKEDGTFKRGSYYSTISFDLEITEYLVKALIQKLNIKVDNYNQLRLKRVFVAEEYTNPDKKLMKFTALASKKISMLFAGAHEKREYIFLHRILLPGSPNLAWNHGLYLLDIPIFAERCQSFGVKILGFEICPDSPYPLFETCFEDFSNEYDAEWYLIAIHIYQQMGVVKMIQPIIEVKTEILDAYLI